MLTSQISAYASDLKELLALNKSAVKELERQNKNVTTLVKKRSLTNQAIQKSLLELSINLGTLCSTTLIFIETLKAQLQAEEQNLKHNFLEILQSFATNQNIHVERRGEDLYFGQFSFKLNFPKQTCQVIFGGIVLDKSLPLSPQNIFDYWRKWNAAIFAPIKELKYEECVKRWKTASKMAVARRDAIALSLSLKENFKVNWSEILPLLTGMMLIEKTPDTTKLWSELSETELKVAPLIWFTAELKEICDQGAVADDLLRLETAVLDNAKKQDHVLYLPNQLEKPVLGGRTYQALTF